MKYCSEIFIVLILFTLGNNIIIHTSLPRQKPFIPKEVPFTETQQKPKPTQQPSKKKRPKKPTEFIIGSTISKKQPAPAAKRKEIFVEILKDFTKRFGKSLDKNTKVQLDTILQKELEKEIAKEHSF